MIGLLPSAASNACHTKDRGVGLGVRWLFIGLLLLACNLFAAPKADLDPYWNEQGQQAQPDVATWQAFLDNYLVKKGQHYLVDYRRVSTSDRQALQQWLSVQASINPLQLAPDAQFAYWVNLYNALTVDLILQNYPLESIRNLGWFNSGPWNRTVIRINDRDLSLNDIEHRILRPIFNDHRIHFAVNCAALGCPNLQPKAFTENALNSQLSEAERAFVNSEKGVAKVSAKRWRLSSIFDWYLEDFASNEAELIKYLNPLLNEAIASDARIDYHYDWQLNETQP
ncbi:DUF547 domain-containing protein [Salinibius halmophilus]|uniref:DUF547 domain-containing protein n=1 Tax=Salinibius halmophilus TaxID=1853216 RepID=UPI0018F51D3C|nr:DUF547 domain-containing protein [Salinibius halmophilus]